ncbi:MAG: EF-hand domain-containing protein [Phycisphaerales bacterium]|nr:EF-hand domain-containing protein [Phycisphaerales bacterium]
MHRCTAIAALVLLAGNAMGQSFNVDFNGTSGNGAGVPAASYGGAAGQAGTWNSITNSSAAVIGLQKIDGTSSSVNLSWNKTTAISGIFDSGITGDNAKLMQDGQFMDSWGTLQYTFSNLAAGTYAVYTYAGKPNFTSEAGVTVTGTTSDYQYIGGNLNNDLMPGDSHAIHIVTVAAGGSVVVKVNDSFNGNASCTGLQLRKIDDGRIRFYVAKSQTGNPNTGVSWANAYDDLQPILQQTALIGGDQCEIWTKSAFYYPTTGSDRNASFVIPSGLHLYGGFSGSETSMDQRLYPWAYITALSGAIGGSTSSDNSYHVVTANGASNSTVLDGFTVANGRATGGGDDSKGGGLFAEATRIRVANTKFISNYAGIEGAGAFTTDYPNFTNCLFYKNEANGPGAGLYHHTSGSPTIYNTEFTGNSSIGDGAAAKVLFADASFFNCLFSGNTASSGSGGAVSIAGDSSDDARFTNCTFSLNHSGASHGGIYGNNQVSVELNNCILWGNTDEFSTDLEDKQYGGNLQAIFIRKNTTVQGLSSNPLFVNADGADGIPGTTDDDCRLQEASSCIDTGDNALVPMDFPDADGDNFQFELYPYDLDGLDRVLDVPWANGAGAVIDRGCYEYQYHTCPADFDESGFVDLDDYVAFVAAFEAGTDNADFDGTGFVDLDDFIAYVAAFEAGC